MKIKPVMKDDELAVIGDILAERSSNPEAVKRQLLWLKYPEAFDAIVSNSPIIAYSRFCNGCQVEIGLSEIDDTYGCHQADCKYVEAVFKLNVENLMEEVINNAWSAACEIEYGGMLVSPPVFAPFVDTANRWLSRQVAVSGNQFVADEDLEEIAEAQDKGGLSFYDL